MPLVLAVHTVLSPSATVPFAVILLQDQITNKRVPVDLKCRQLVPSSGSKSTSLWDVRDPDELQHWLDEAINVDVTHEVFEVQEEFAIGLGEVARARAAEKMMDGTKDVVFTTGRGLSAAATTVGAQINEVDHKLRITERATAASAAIKESAVGRSTSAAFTKVGAALGVGTKKVMENDKVASAVDTARGEVSSATEAVGSSFKKLGASLSSLTGRRSSTSQRPGEGEGGLGGERTPQFVQEDVTYDAPANSSFGGTGGAGMAPPPAPAPAPAPVQQNVAPVKSMPAAAPAAAAAAPVLGSPAVEKAKFALDENETRTP